MLPVRLFARAEFGLINLASFAMGFGTLATFFLLSLYLQSVRGAAPTEAGLQFLVIAALFALTGFGLSTAGVPTSTIALQAVPRHQSGIASATVTATRQTGTALGVAVLGALVAAGLHQALLVAGTVTGDPAASQPGAPRPPHCRPAASAHQPR